MADGSTQIEELEQEVKLLNHRMYQVEEVLRTLQNELQEIKQDSAASGLSNRQR